MAALLSLNTIWSRLWNKSWALRVSRTRKEHTRGSQFLIRALTLVPVEADNGYENEYVGEEVMAESEWYKDLSEQHEVEDIMREGGETAVIDFWAPWCGPCKAMGPHFETVARHFSKEDEPVSFYKVNTEAHQDLARAFNVRSIPTLVFVHDGEIADVHIGALDAHRLKKKVETHLSKARGEGFLTRMFGIGKKKAD